MLKLHAPFAIGAALALAAPAMAADYIPEPPVVEYEEPAPEPSYGGWYLRGHIAMTNQRLKRLENPDYATLTDAYEFLDKGHFGSGMAFGLGAGYKVNHYLRLDGIVEYRGKTSFSALDRYDDPTIDPGNPAWDATNEHSAKKSEWLLMANAYADLGEFYGITPYIGAGLGASRNTIHDYRDTNVPMGGVAFGGTKSKWDLAWALHAGVGIKAGKRTTIDLGYSYLHLGSGHTNAVMPYDGSSGIAAYKLKDITSHDFKLGVRYALY